MSEEQLKAFLEQVKDSVDLRNKIEAANSIDAIVTIAKQTGFLITAEEVKSVPTFYNALSQQEMEGTTGGGSCGGLFCNSQNYSKEGTSCGGAGGIESCFKTSACY